MPKLRFRTVFWLAACLVVAGFLAWSFAPRPVPADMAEVTRGTMTVYVRDEGYTRVREAYTVSAPLGGRLLRVEIKAGDHVEAGQGVASILPSDPALLDSRSRSEAEAALRSAEALLGFARAELERLQAEADYAQGEYSRYQTLAERGAASQSVLDRARLQLRSSSAAMETARANVRAREAEREAVAARLMAPGEDADELVVVRVTSPIRGRVLRVLQESETVIQPGGAIMEIGDPGDLEIVAELLSSDAVQVRQGAPARIEAWGGSGELRARVRRVEPFGFMKVSALGVEEQRVNVILDLLDPQEDWAGLGHGFRVRPHIQIWRGEDEVIAPVAALFRQDGGWAVFVAENGRARMRRVEIGRNNGREAQILSGLEPGETLILYPSERIDGGVAVRPREG